MHTQYRASRRYRKRGGDATFLLFEGADHGHGGYNSAAGRGEIRRWLRGRGLAVKSAAPGGDAAGDAAQEVFGIPTTVYARSGGGGQTSYFKPV